jgi:hypothetical protein
MKIRKGFVTNSSSTIYIISNKTKKNLTLVDFVKENPELVQIFNDIYDYDYTQQDMIDCAEVRVANNDKAFFPAGEEVEMSYGDEDGDPLGHVFDYILRNGGQSKSFGWRFYEYNR